MHIESGPCGERMFREAEGRWSTRDLSGYIRSRVKALIARNIYCLCGKQFALDKHALFFTFVYAQLSLRDLLKNPHPFF
jgi:hypothetical protein